MVSKKFWKNSIVEFVNLVKGEKQRKTFQILDTSFEIFPEVFSPIYSSDTAWFAEKIIPLTKNKKFLEIGSGSGAIACLASIHGALNVVATDINPHAIKNILSNANLHSLHIEARIGDVFDPISNDELFDIIFWNHPFYYSEEVICETDVVSLSVYDTEYQSLEKFIAQGKKHLKMDGQLILGTSNIAKINLIKKLAAAHSYNLDLLEKTEVPVHRKNKTKMDLRVYSLKPMHFS